MAREVPVSGFSLVRGGPGLDYPVVASLRSLLPLVDELVVTVDRRDAATHAAIRGLDDARIALVATDWDDGPKGRGLTLARQANAALARCRHPWAFYLQADEVVHEEDLPVIRAALARWDGARAVDALTFRFLHFEGSYVRVNPLRYRRQCRLVRNDGRLVVAGDGAGFARVDGRRLATRRSGARIFHYGWAAAPEALKAKLLALARYYRAEAEVAARWSAVPAESLARPDLAFRWRGSHPAVMRARVAGAGADWERRYRRAPFGAPLLNPAFYGAWLRKWRVLPRW